MVTLIRLLARGIKFTSQALGQGTGITWSGEIALRLDPHILGKLISPDAPVILIAGTNGKTTTSAMINTILSPTYTVVHNDTGANLVNGIVGTVLTSKAEGKVAYVFEVDESNLPLVLDQVEPDVLVLLNLFRDQLDRYGEVDAIVSVWRRTLEQKQRPKLNLIVNGDDPQLAYLGQQLTNQVKSVQFFNIDDPSLFLAQAEHATDSTLCPACGTPLTFTGIYFSHLGQYHCPTGDFTQPSPNLMARDIVSPLEGIYNIYNSLAATLAARDLSIDKGVIATRLATFTPAFGRLEKVELAGHTVKIVLGKNPAGFNVSLRTVLDSTHEGPLLLVLNDRVPDGHDVSWIWDVDFEMLQAYKYQISVSGDRHLDLAVRLKYAEVPCTPIADLREAVSQEGLAWILPTYSAMLEVRQLLTGRNIL